MDAPQASGSGTIIAVSLQLSTYLAEITALYDHILPGIAAKRQLLSGIYTFVMHFSDYRNKSNLFSRAYEGGTGLAFK
jgi:hypothetical protein